MSEITDLQRETLPARVAANVTALIALDVTNSFVYPSGTIAWVATLKDYFVLDRSSAVTNDTTNFLYVTATVGRWVRQCIVNSAWLATTTWYVDPTSGSNENDGAGSGTALKTWSELNRRFRGLWFNTSTMTINLLTSLAAGDPIVVNWDASLSTSASTGTIAIVGTRTVVASGTLTAVTVMDETINQPYEVTSAAGFASYVKRYIRFLNGVTFRCSAWIAKDLGAGAARISMAVDENGTNSAVQTSPVIGDNYDICSFVTAPGAYTNHSRLSFVRISHVDFQQASNSVSIQGLNGFLRLTGCSINATPTIRQYGGLGLVNCLVGGNASITGPLGSRSTFLSAGLYTTVANATGTQHGLSGQFAFNNPMFQDVYILCDDVTQPASGNYLSIFDCPASAVRALYLHQNCNIIFNILWGSGNAPTSTLIQMGTNCSLSVFVTLTLTGSPTYGVSMGNEPVQRVMSDMLYSDFQDIFGAIMRGPGGGSPSVFNGSFATNKPAMLDCGEDLVPFRVCRADAVSGMVKAQADTSAHATGVYGVSNSQNTSGGRIVFVNSGFVTINFDVAPTVGDIVYLSPTTAGNATVTVPPVSGTNQKLRLGTVVRVLAGTLAVVHFRPELIPVTSDGVAP